MAVVNPGYKLQLMLKSTFRVYFYKKKGANNLTQLCVLYTAERWEDQTGSRIPLNRANLAQ